MRKLLTYGLGTYLALSPVTAVSFDAGKSKLSPNKLEEIAVPDNDYSFTIASAATTGKTSRGLQPEIRSDYVGLRYSTGFKEFLNGVAYPLTFWRKNPNTEKTEIWPYVTHPIREGGIVSFFNPSAWSNNASLTGGSLTGTAILGAGIALALPHKKKDDKKDTTTPPGTTTPPVDTGDDKNPGQ